MKVRVDPDLCIACGLCVEICPGVFELSGDFAEVREGADCSEFGCCEEAAEACPTGAIEIS